MGRSTVFTAFPLGFGRLSAFAVAAILAGCSANVAPSAEAADAESNASSSLAVIVVEQSAAEEAGAAAASTTNRAEAVARFLRMRGSAVDADALRMVGAVLDLPATGTCAMTTTLATARPSTRAAGAAAAPRVELLDVGSLAVEANGVVTPLLPRRLPDVADLVSGVFYARAVDGDALPARARYVVRGQDGSALVQATAPAELSGLRTAHQTTVPGDRAVDVTWEAGNADPGTSDDLVYVDVVGTDGTVRCVFPDGGHGVLPANAIPASPNGVTATAHRLHREATSPRERRSGRGPLRFARSLALPR